MKTIIKAALILLLTQNAFSSYAQASKDSVASWLNNKRFVFTASSMDPLRGATRFITGNYDLTLRNDSIISYLPYIGRSQMAPLTPEETGLIFTSTVFDYNVAARKKNGWIVTMNMKDQTNISRYTLTVFTDGTAMLNTTSNFRDPVSFRGYVRAVK